MTTNEQKKHHRKKKIRTILSFPKRSYKLKHGTGTIKLSGRTVASPDMKGCLDIYIINKNVHTRTFTIPIANIIS